MMEDLTGKRFGRLTVLEFDHKDKYYNSYWKCRCDCGNELIATAGRLRSGHSKSCGCYSRERAAEVCKTRTTHNLSKHPLYGVWSNMIARCENPKNPDFQNWYGSKGVTVCDEWRNDFKVFYDWAMLNGYKKGLTIDRVNGEGNYEPDNCRWVTPKKQANNTSRNKLIEFEGETRTLSEWADYLGINYHTLQGRIRRSWSVKDAFNIPILKNTDSYERILEAQEGTK
jgi:hypothetical protein